MSVNTDTAPKRVSLDTPVSALFAINWELVLYGIILLLAVGTRFYELGARVMSHDESLHTLYSWNLYAGKGYQHDPLMHGPFLFHATALMYLLFGDNDFTARLTPALLSVILVMLPYFFRPWLGRLGALATSFMILISPGLMYYGRYIRHDMPISVWTTLMVLAFFQFMRTRATPWLYVGALAVSLMLSTKEISYIHGFIGVTFIVLAFMWEWLPQARRNLLSYAIFGLIVVLLGLVGYGWFGLDEAARLEDETTGFNLWAHTDAMMMVVFILLGALIVRLAADRKNQPVSHFLQSLPPRLMDIGRAALAALIVWVLLHTTFFSNINGLYTGSIGEIVYWLDQHGVQRGGQPWYYYLMLVPLYEILPVLVGGIGALVYIVRGKFPAHADPPPLQSDGTAPAHAKTDGAVHWASDGGTFAGFVIYWALLAFSIYSWAGEKMPWLTIHMTLPLIFVSGHVIQSALGNFNWREAYRRGGLLLGFALLLLPAALLAIFTADPFRSQSLQSINETTQFIAGIVVLLALLAAMAYFGRRLGISLAAKSALVTALLFLSLLTVRFAFLLNFVNYDYVNEPLVYAHASPDVKLALNQIDDISRRTVGDKMIRVAYDNDSTWPLEWYMREYPNRVYYGENPTREALDSPIVIVGSANETKAKPYLGDNFTQFNYRLVWWPVEDYKNQSIRRLLDTYVTGPADVTDAEARRQTVRDNWRKLLKIVFYREYEDYTLNEWPFVHRFNVYVRNDVLNDVWDFQSGPVQFTSGGPAASLDPYAGKRTETEAIATWGSNGSGDGQLNAPRNLAVGPDGSIYVADSGNHRVQVFDAAGNYLLQWGSEGAGPGQFSEPWGIAVGPDGRVYVADTWNHRVQIFGPTGEYLDTFGEFANVQTGDPQTEPGKFWGPRDIAIDAGGNLYVTDTGNKRVEKFTADGIFLQTWGGGGIIPGTFEEPVGIAIDSQGNIYVADTWNRRVQKFDSNFNPVLQWDVVGWDGESIVNKPYITVDDQNRVLISDPEGYRIIGYDANTGDTLVTWGQYGQDMASLALPIGLKTDAQGNLLVVDSDNNRVMKFQIPTVAPAEEANPPEN